MIKLFDFEYIEDYSKLFKFTIGSYKQKYAILEIIFSFDDYPGTIWIRLDCGLNQVLCFILSIWRFTFEVNFLAKIYKHD